MFISGSDLKTDGFSIESCRSMVAVMDVSFHISVCIRMQDYTILYYSIPYYTIRVVDIKFYLNPEHTERQHRKTRFP